MPYQRWEYTTIVVDGHIAHCVESLDQHGRSGWEAIHVHVATRENGEPRTVVLMKRPLQDDKNSN
jgi:hypothetical protein